MASFLHRAWHPGSGEFQYWSAPVFDPAGASYTGPPPFGELQDVTLILVTITEGAPFPEIGKAYTPPIEPGFSPGFESFAAPPSDKEIGVAYDAVIPPP